MQHAAPALMVYCTCPDDVIARQLAHAGVEAGLAACVNVVSGVRSVFRWQGAVSEEAEILLVAKTTAEAFAALEALWVAQHPYELPEVIAVPITHGSEAYLAWITDAVSA